MTLLEAALAYAARGWRLFPIVPGQKAPALFKDYFSLASNDPEQIRAWWESVPNANIGLACGESGIVAIDVDSEAGHGKSHAGTGAVIAGLKLLSGGKRAWDTLVSNTPTGGQHYLFQLDQSASAGQTPGGSDDLQAFQVEEREADPEHDALVRSAEQSSPESLLEVGGTLDRNGHVEHTGHGVRPSGEAEGRTDTGIVDPRLGTVREVNSGLGSTISPLHEVRVQDEVRSGFVAGNRGFIRTGSRNFGVGGVDVRSQGGYVVLPPSVIAKGSYAWADPSKDLLPVPRKLLSMEPPGARGDDGKTSLEQSLHAGDKILAGGRDNFLVSVAGKLRDQGFGYNEIRAVVESTYRERCDDSVDPFNAKDFERIANSVMKYAAKTNAFIAATEASLQPEGIYNATDETTAIPATAFLTTYTEPTNWLVDGIFQASSLNMMMGPPKAGKSTLMRHLSVCVGYGLPFLGRFHTKKNRVLYYSLQENKPHLRKWLMDALVGAKISEIGQVPPDMPIDFVFTLNHRGPRAIKGTLERIQSHEYGLILIDMYGRYAGVESLDDYAENEAITDLLNGVAQKTGACVIWSHHERKSGGGGGGDTFQGAIGSQAIRGAVYTTLRNWKDGGRYYVSTEQRDGEDLPPTAITLDKKTQSMKAVGSHVTLALADEITREARIRECLLEDPQMGVKAITEIVGGQQRHNAKIVEKIKKEQA